MVALRGGGGARRGGGICFGGFAARLGVAARVGVDGPGSVPGSDDVRCGLFWSVVRGRLLGGAGWRDG